MKFVFQNLAEVLAKTGALKKFSGANFSGVNLTTPHIEQMPNISNCTFQGANFKAAAAPKGFPYKIGITL
jgi:uncharacterized protein YjbI with pentapeptide repeats